MHAKPSGRATGVQGRLRERQGSSTLSPLPLPRLTTPVPLHCDAVRPHVVTKLGARFAVSSILSAPRSTGAAGPSANDISGLFQAEARLAAKRAARAEARDIRMKELERQQKEVRRASWCPIQARCRLGVAPACVSDLRSRSGQGGRVPDVPVPDARPVGSGDAPPARGQPRTGVPSPWPELRRLTAELDSPSPN